MHLQIESVTVLPSNGQHFCIPRRTERLKVTANYCGKYYCQLATGHRKLEKQDLTLNPLSLM